MMSKKKYCELGDKLPLDLQIIRMLIGEWLNRRLII
jgi:hypothetical protein